MIHAVGSLHPATPRSSDGHRLAPGGCRDAPSMTCKLQRRLKRSIVYNQFTKETGGHPAYSRLRVSIMRAFPPCVTNTLRCAVLMLVVIGLLFSISAASPESRQALPAYVPLSHSYPSAADHNQGAVTDSESSTCNASGVTCRIGDVRGVGRARLFSQCGQDQYVAERFGLTERGGFFVEMGARDGLDDSNTKFFEETLGWRGLLVEARPAFAEPLSWNRPRAYVLHGAIARHANCTYYDVRTPAGAIEPGWSGLVPNKVPTGGFLVPYLVRCYELDPVLQLLKVAQIDYFSLDVEGAELSILETLRWDRINIGVLGVESSDASDARVRRLLRAHGLQRVQPPPPMQVKDGYGGSIAGYPPENAPQPCWPDHFYVNTSWPRFRHFGITTDYDTTTAGRVFRR